MLKTKVLGVSVDPNNAGVAAPTVDLMVRCIALGSPGLRRYFRGRLKMRGVLDPMTGPKI
jgi:hypothetical protein